MYRTVVIAALLVGVVAGAACGGDDDDGGRVQRSTTTASTTTTAPTPEGAVETAYLAYWEMAQRLVEAPDPDDPEIAERATGRALETFTESLTTLEEAGRVVRHGPQHAHDVQSVDVSGESAQVRDCAVDDASNVDLATDSTLDRGLITALYEATLVQQAGAWRVSELSQLDGWEGAVPCVE
jgi:hypothetical protein